MKRIGFIHCSELVVAVAVALERPSFCARLWDVQTSALLLSWPLTAGYGIKWALRESCHRDKHTGELWLVARWQMCPFIGGGHDSDCNLQSGNRSDNKVCLCVNVYDKHARSAEIFRGFSLSFSLSPIHSLFFPVSLSLQPPMTCTFHLTSPPSSTRVTVLWHLCLRAVRANCVQVTKSVIANFSRFVITVTNLDRQQFESVCLLVLRACGRLMCAEEV